MKFEYRKGKCKFCGHEGKVTEFQELIKNLTKAVKKGENTHFSVSDSLFGETQIGINFKTGKDN